LFVIDAAIFVPHKYASGANLEDEAAMQTLIKKFWKDERGATAIEYGLIAAGISIAIIAVVQTLGTNLNTTFSSVSTALK
jgi:pilus assembly protein Flp/PilA